MRNLKVLGLSLVAVFAMSAMLASAAQAEAGATPAQFTIEGGGSTEATITGKQVGANVFTREGRQVTCETATLHGTIKNGETTAAATPTYTSCHSIILGTKFPATVTMNGCTYTFTLTADRVGEQDTFTALSSLICPKEKTVEIHVYSNHTNHTNNTSLCTYTIYGSSDEKNQKLKHIDLTNEPASPETPKNWLLAHVTISNINDTSHGSEFFCGKASSTTSSLHGTGEIKAETIVGGSPLGITVSTEEP